MSSRGIAQLSRPRIALAAAVAAVLLAGGTVAAVAATGSMATAASTPASRAAPDTPTTATASQYTFIHDPTMAEENGTYYVFSTGDPAGVIGNGNIQIRTSRTLRDWTYTGTVFAGDRRWAGFRPRRGRPGWQVTASGSGETTRPFGKKA
jgi:hypothetical protein